MCIITLWLLQLSWASIKFKNLFLATFVRSTKKLVSRRGCVGSHCLQINQQTQLGKQFPKEQFLKQSCYQKVGKQFFTITNNIFWRSSNNSLWIAELWRYLMFFMKFQLNQVSLRVLTIQGSVYDSTWNCLCFLYLEIKAKKEITRPLRKCTNIFMKHPEP